MSKSCDEVPACKQAELYEASTVCWSELTSDIVTSSSRALTATLLFHCFFQVSDFVQL